jgi:hypothetical protein
MGPPRFMTQRLEKTIAMYRAEPFDVRNVARGPLAFATLCLALMLFAAPRQTHSQGEPVQPPVAQPPAAQPPVAQPPVAQPPVDAPPALADAPVTEEAPDGGWPRSIQTATGASIVLFQPQVLEWKDQRHMVAMAAVSYTPRGAQSPDLGTIRLESPTSTSVEERMVSFSKIDVTQMYFSSLDKPETQEVLSEIRKSLPKENLVIALDRILVAADTSMISAKGIKINTEPPPIFFSKEAAILLQFDGEMIMAPISGTTLRYAVNTNWDLFHDDDLKIYYLRNDTYWLQTPDLVKWTPIEGKKLPESFKKLPEDGNWAETKANIPGKKMKGKMPVVFVSNRPAELILVDGSPKYEKVKETKLLWLKNTETDVFRMDEKPKDHYALFSGRWFKTAELEKGPWVFASSSLPPDFAKIPKGHERARVLSSVPGTEEAAQGVLLALVPRTARVDAKSLGAPDVKYDGEPQFEPIKGTKGGSVSYAVNTGFDVLQTGGLYYLCYQGVWFSSKSATGPWAVTTSIPESIYSIPSDSPAHHVTYVTVVEDDDDYPVYGYTAGYTGVSIAFGCAMWGSGYYYPPYYRYPAYYPRPVAYGCGATYNPWTGAYGGYQAAYGPYGGVARGASYNPNTGTYARGATAWGPGGSRSYAQAYNPRTGTYAQSRQGSNVYGSWGSSSVHRGDDWVRTQRVTDSQGNTKWKAQGSGGGSATGIRGDQGSGFVGQKGDDVYAGRDGNVYRKNEDGWQQWDKGQGWNDVEGGQGGNRPGAGGGGQQRPAAGQQPATQPGQRPSAGQQPSQRPSAGQQPSASQRPSQSQLDRDAQARSRGSQASRDYGSYQRGGGSSSRGGGGGGRRGGGGGGRRR